MEAKQTTAAVPPTGAGNTTDPGTDSPGQTHAWRRLLAWLFGLAVLATVVLVCSRFTEIAHFGELARAARPHWLIVAATLQGLTYLCAAGVWHGVLARGGVQQRFWSLVPLGMAQLFADQALPAGGISGTLLVLSGLERRGISQSIGMAALLVGMVSFYAAYVIAVVFAFWVLYDHDALDPLMIGAAVLFIVIAFAIPASVLTLQYWSRRQSSSGLIFRATRWLNRIPGFSLLMSAMRQASPSLLRDRRALVRATVLQLAVFALDSCTLWAMLQAVGIEASLTACATAFMLASLAATIGPIPLGLGTFEAVCVAVLHIQEIPIEGALTATLLLRGFTFWLPMIPGLMLARRELRHPRPDHA